MLATNVKFGEGEIFELQARRGRVGSIQFFDPYAHMTDRDSLIKYIADIATISYGNEAAANPPALFKTLLRLDHLSVLEFAPLVREDVYSTIRADNLRSFYELYENLYSQEELLDAYCAASEDSRESRAAIGMTITCPIFVARQWMRHGVFTFLELSRRYVKASKVPFEFYGGATAVHDSILDEYDRRIKSGEPAELARGIIPVEAMTTFHAAAYIDDLHRFIETRTDKAAQPEIRVFADKIKEIAQL